MEIKKTSRELNKVEKYLLTQSNNMISVKDIEDGTKIDFKAFAVYTDINSKDEEVEILSIMTPNNHIYATQSATFKKSFLQIFETMGDTLFAVIKTSGTTKAGRPYVDCVLDIESVAV